MTFGHLLKRVKPVWALPHSIAYGLKPLAAEKQKAKPSDPAC
jgi:hypothetical protein